MLWRELFYCKNQDLIVRTTGYLSENVEKNVWRFRANPSDMRIGPPPCHLNFFWGSWPKNLVDDDFFEKIDPGYRTTEYLSKVLHGDECRLQINRSDFDLSWNRGPYPMQSFRFWGADSIIACIRFYWFKYSVFFKQRRRMRDAFWEWFWNETLFFWEREVRVPSSSSLPVRLIFLNWNNLCYSNKSAESDAFCEWF